MMVDYDQVKEDFAKKDAEIAVLKARLNQFNEDLDDSGYEIMRIKAQMKRQALETQGDYSEMQALTKELKAAEDANTLLDAVLCNMDLAEKNLAT